MSITLSTIFAVSLTALVLGVAYEQLRTKEARRLKASIVLIALATIVFFFLKADTKPNTLETKGPAESMAVVFCYLSMLLGMVAEYGYAQAERGDKHFKFDMQFLMPIFASPIVFIPLLTITTDMTLSGAFTKQKLMVYLVAFQNGFFWKSFFEERRHKPILPVTTTPSEVLEPVAKERAKAAGAK